jgi:hypothetical protein
MIMRTAVSTCSIVALVVLLGASAATAQGHQIGAKAGPNFSITVLHPEDSDDDYDRRVSSTAGGFAVLQLTKYLALQVEALFNPKGAKLYDPEQNLTAKVLLRYLDFPVLARVSGPRSASRAFHAFAGPYGGIRLNAIRELSTAGSSAVAGQKTDMSTEVERFEFGFLGGAGVDIGRYIVIDGRYAQALTDLNTDRSDNFHLRNRMFTVMVGIRLSRR